MIPRSMIPLRFTRARDGRVESTAVFAADDGTVTISIAQYKALMSNGGWEQYGGA